jgi:LmbE family N-acetylglucosaminyl deacetylase
MTPAAPAEPPVSNAARFVARPLSNGGTPTQVWLNSRPALPMLDLTACREIVVVAAHPDDETLGFGATSAMLADMGVRVQVVSVSDGGASHPGLSQLERQRVEQIRRTELDRAVRALGLPDAISLGLPDGQIGDHEYRLADLLSEFLASRSAETWCAATWRGDGHPDHEAVGRAAAIAVARTGATLLEYPVWMWHWASPDDAAVPWNRAREVPLTGDALGRKHLAVQSFPSQFDPSPAGEAPVVPPAVVHRLLAVSEVVFC